MDRLDVDITGLTADSRAVKPGYLFAALKGSEVDGARFIPDALKAGAAAVLVDHDISNQYPDIPVLVDENPRRRLALLAAQFYRKQPHTIVAVTGTAGKTSVTVFLRQIWEHLGFHAASMGTIGIVEAGLEDSASLTTPDPVALHNDLARMVDRGVDFLALEASSHGLDQYRLDGVRVSAAVFTNLGHDHLDYHAGMDDYFAAKARLFTEILPTGGVALIKADDDYSERLIGLCRERGIHSLTYGRWRQEGSGPDLSYEVLGRSELGLALRIRVLEESRDVWLPLTGDFQAENALAAAGAAIALGADVMKALDVLPDLLGAPGRMELVGETTNGAKVFVDYSHKPEALEFALQALRAETRGRLKLVFGCGGDRDRTKRAVMGKIAVRHADDTIVTDDNPRSEDPALIRAEILQGATGAKEIGDRREAIRQACDSLQAGDVLLVAGKGHEQGQNINGVIHPFDDRTEVRAALGLDVKAVA